MKGLITLGVIGLIAAIGSMLVVKKMNEDPGQMVAVAFGNPADGQVEIHTVVLMGMVAAEPVRVDAISGFPYWDEWLEQHWDLRDGKGNRVSLERASNSSVINHREAGNAFEFFLVGRVPQGDACTFEYIPRKREKRRYRYSFTAPSSQVAMKRHTFELVEGE